MSYIEVGPSTTVQQLLMPTNPRLAKPSQLQLKLLTCAVLALLQYQQTADP